MTPGDLLRQLADRLWRLADDAARDLAAGAAAFPSDPDAPPPLQGRLLVAFERLPDGNALARLARELLGELPAGGPVRLHGWQRAPDAPRGVALVASDPSGTAALAVTPGSPPPLDVVVTPGSRIAVLVDRAVPAWSARVEVSSDAGWDAAVVRGLPSAPPTGSATISVERATPLTVGFADGGPSVSAARLAAELRAGPAGPPALRVDVDGFEARLLPPALAALLGAGRPAAAGGHFSVRADAAGGLRFDGGGLRLDLPAARLPLPTVSLHGFGLELASDPQGIALSALAGLKAQLPGLPVSAALDDVGLRIPFALDGARIGPKLDGRPPLPSGIAVALDLRPVSGGGALFRLGDDSYGGALDLDLGLFRVQAFGLLTPPDADGPTSLLALMSAFFPYPGIQLGFGFALDAVGGLVGVNRRVDLDQLRALVAEGNVDRVLFPDDVAGRAREIARSLDAVFPPARGRSVVGPMVRVNWSGRMVRLSGAVVLDLPSPRMVLLGRLVVAVPDPDAPLVLLQASIFSTIDPSVPQTEVLGSLDGSRIATTSVSGDVYLLTRGGGDPTFVLSAGGFHPRYVKPAGVPPLDRLAMDLGGGYLGLRAEAYVAVTSTAAMFGAKLELDATIAGCGVTGSLELDALFVREPTFSFSVHVRASVAVRVLGRRLASVGLDFTLEGPAPWHAFGTGTVSVWVKDISLGFDVTWGDRQVPPPPAAPEIRPALLDALRDRSAWAVERPPAQRSAVRLTDAARAELTAGTVVAADATLRVSQRVVPLGETVTRFAYARVPAQRWDVAAAGAPVRERFVTGAFFDLAEEQQLTAPGFTDARSGAALAMQDVRVGSARRVDERYETRYRVEPADAPPEQRRFNVAFAALELELLRAVPTAPDQRLALWQLAQRPLRSAQVRMR